MRITLLLISIAFAFAASGQKSLQGKVMIEGGHTPVPSANIYLSTTSIGTVSNEKGDFILQRFPEGRYDLVVSCVGYETYHLTIRSDQLPPELNIFLIPKVEELQEVILEPYDKDGWEKWGKIFIDNFIGTAEFASECKLVNKDVLRFRVSKKTNTLKVTAKDQLVIENNALGYILRYSLTQFEFQLDSKEFIYGGFPFFEEMTTTRKGAQKRWIANRETAYDGSLMHFMRSIYADKVQEEKFEVHEWYNVPAVERRRVKDSYPYWSKKVVSRNIAVFTTKGSFAVDEKDTSKMIHPDTLAYYKSIMKQIDEENIYIDVLLSKKDLAFVEDDQTLGLKFRGHIQVVYGPKQNPVEYQPYISKLSYFLPVKSDLHRKDNMPVSILANGFFFDGTNLYASGFLSWWEKLCNKLPYDYEAVKK